LTGKSFETLSTRPGIYYGWRVVAMGFILFVLMYGTRFSFGLYIKPLAEAFEANRASISGPQSLFMAVYAVFSLLAGTLVDRYGPKRMVVAGALLIGAGMLLSSRITSVWQYFITYGVLVGIGCGATYVPAMGAVSKFFNRRRNFALGITAAGGGIGHFLFPPFVQKMLDLKGWETAFFSTGLIILVLGLSLPWVLLRGKGLPEDAGIQVLEEESAKEEEKSLHSPGGSAEEPFRRHYTLRQAMATRPFWTYFAAYFIFCFLIDGTLFVHLPPYFTDKGFSGQTAATAFGYIGIISTAAMVLLGPLGDRVNKRILMTSLFGAQTLVIYWIIHIEGTIGLWGITIFCGLFVGMIVPLTVSILAEIFGSRHVSSILGAATIAYGIAGLIAPWVAGYTFDLYQSYIPMFYFTMVLSIVAAVCMFFTRKTMSMTGKVHSEGAGGPA
jgi:MFS family permease